MCSSITFSHSNSIAVGNIMINIVYHDKYLCILCFFTSNITLYSVNLHGTIYHVYLVKINYTIALKLYIYLFYRMARLVCKYFSAILRVF